MIENQKQQQTYEYELIPSSVLPSIENFTAISSEVSSSTSGNYQAYKYWNPATNGIVPSESQAQVKQLTVDQLIGELKQ